MAFYNKLVLTNIGESTLTEVLSSGRNLLLSELRLSANVYNQTEIKNLVSLSNTANIIETSSVLLEKETDNFIISGSFSNKDITEALTLNSIGLYSTLDNTTKLIGVATAIEPIIIKPFQNTVNFYNLKLSLALKPSEYNAIKIINNNIGPEGPQGEPGIPGVKGDKGEKGDAGPQGLKGKDGYTPIKDIDYFDGAQGPEGPEGLQGLKGDKGDTGSIGPEGPQGPQGDIGPKGDTGPTGTTGKSAYQLAIEAGFVGTEAAWRVSLKGDKGDTGLQGPQGLAGEKGDQGDPGEQGPEGPVGPQGLPGQDGQDVDLTDVQAMIDTQIGNIEAALAQVIGGF